MHWAVFLGIEVINVLFVFLRANHALAANVPPRPWEMTTFHNVSGLPPHIPPLFVECNFLCEMQACLRESGNDNFHAKRRILVKSGFGRPGCANINKT